DDDDEVVEQTVANEGLLSIEDVAVAVAYSAGLDGGEVAAGVRLGHGDGADERALGHAGQPARLLRLVAVVADVGHNHVAMHAETHAHRASAGNLLDEDGVVAEVAHPTAAVLLRHVRAEKALSAGLLPESAGYDALFLPLGVIRHDLRGDKTAEGVAEHA